MKKIAIFSDIHGNLQALTSILEDIDRDNFDEVICLGDVIGIGPNPKECLDIIIDSNIKMIKGNHEIYQINEYLVDNHLTDSEKKHRDWINSLLNEEEIEYIRNIPMSYEKLINGKLFTFSHFILNSDKDYYEELNILSNNKIFELANNQETDYMFVGHSHDAFQILNNELLTCVGSSGCRKNNMTFYTIIEINNGGVRITKKEIPYDRKAFEKEMKDSDYPNSEFLNSSFFGINIS